MSHRIGASFVIQVDGRLAEVADRLTAEAGAVFDGRRFRVPWSAEGEARVDSLSGELSAEAAGGTLMEGTLVLLADVTASSLKACRVAADALLGQLAQVAGTDSAFVLSLIADPTAPGAESAAPPSLEATVRTDWVEFTVTGPWMGNHRRAASGVLVEARGVTLKTPTFERQVTWDELVRCEVADRDGALVLALVGADDGQLGAVQCSGSSDDAWLAAYLQAQADRRRETSEERIDRQRQSMRMEALLKAVGPEEES